MERDFMGVPGNKAQLLTAIDTSFDKLMRYLSAVPKRCAPVRTMEGHAKNTQMSVCDLVAYLIGWNSLVIKWITLSDAGKPVDFPETGYKWNQLGLLAQKFYQDREGEDLSTLIAELRSLKTEIIVLIEARSDHELYGKTWYTKWTMGRMISFNTSSPYTNACGRLRKWAKEHQVSL